MVTDFLDEFQRRADIARGTNGFSVSCEMGDSLIAELRASRKVVEAAQFFNSTDNVLWSRQSNIDGLMKLRAALAELSSINAISTERK